MKFGIKSLLMFTAFVAAWCAVLSAIRRIVYANALTWHRAEIGDRLGVLRASEFARVQANGAVLAGALILFYVSIATCLWLSIRRRRRR